MYIVNFIFFHGFTWYCEMTPSPYTVLIMEIIIIGLSCTLDSHVGIHRYMNFFSNLILRHALGVVYSQQYVIVHRHSHMHLISYCISLRPNTRSNLFNKIQFPLKLSSMPLTQPLQAKDTSISR